MVEEWDNREDSPLMNAARLMSHIAVKGFQAGSLIGCAVVVPVVAYRSRGSGSQAFRLLQAAGTSAVWGTGISTMIGAVRVAQLGSTMSQQEFAEGMQDRAYRLHYNKGQRRTDFFASLGMAAGATGAMVLVSPAAAVVLGGAAVGSSVGLLAHAATMEKKAE